jgi:hypothetical protein
MFPSLLLFFVILVGSGMFDVVATTRYPTGKSEETYTNKE